MTVADLAEVGPRLSTRRYGRSLEVLEETDSTMDDARRAAAEGAADGHVVVADRQRRGRGSHGRRWDSPPGEDLYLSIVARPPLSPADLPPLTLAVGLGVAEAVESLGAPGAEVKWPNDVRVGGRKCAGILVETSSSGERVDAAILGIGLDVNRQRFAPELAELATSLRLATGAPLDRADCLAALLAHVEAWVDRLVAHGPEPVIAGLERRLAWRGERVRCDGVEGRLEGVDPDGALVIAGDAGRRRVLAGTLERA